MLIADDDGLFARALEALLDVEPSISIVGCALDGDEAARLAAQLLPDVILMDLSMPRVDGFDATKRIRELVPETAIVVLTGSRDDADVARAKDAGAAGYVTKDRILGELVDAIHAAANAA
ncbi:MAG TPA: response regulator transcription factor [Gaiellaceae bacterium]|nr:response regulator transcription factor [Gaiellaceae bacterium]